MKKRKYKLTTDLPEYAIKKDMVFEYDEMEDRYVTKELPWMFTPLVTKEQIKDKKLFTKI